MAEHSEDGQGWKDGIPYQNVQIINGEYYETNGKITKYTGWSRTELLPCKGASYITVYGYNGVATPNYNCFYDADGTFVSNFGTGHPETALFTVNVPANAAFVGFSWTTSGLSITVNKGITPYA